MFVSLPEQLENAIESALRELPTSQWMKAARTVSERYRAKRDGTEQPLARGASEALGYAALILPAAYAQLSGAIKSIKTQAPNWQPTTMLDIGSGPGTALWAALEQWPSLQTLTAWEREPAFIKLGQRLALSSDKRPLSQTQWERVVIGRKLPDSLPTYDLIVFGHVLNELPATTRREIVSLAWKHCSGVLLIVEPGTSTAFPVVRAMREFLLAQGAQTLAPCAHNCACPLTDDWCHFPQRLNRPRFQRRAKEASAGWEESKFCYAAMARFSPNHPTWGRLIHQPHKQKGMVELTISSKDGLIRPRIPRRAYDLYRQISSYEWGDTLDTPIQTEY